MNEMHDLAPNLVSGASDAPGRAERLHESRRELRRVWIGEDASDGGAFPRSKTMRALSKHRVPILLAIGGGLLLLRPRWVGWALRFVPMNGIARMLASRVVDRW